MQTRGRRRLREVSLPDGFDRQVGGPGPDQLAERNQLEAAFGRLDIDQRTILVLHHLGQRPVADIAEVLHIPVGTAKSRLHAARAALERALEVRPTTPPTVTDRAIEMMLRERGGATVPSDLENAIVAAVRAESARAGTPWRRWLARPTLRPALDFALLALLLAALLAATYVGGQNGITVPAGTASPAPSASSAPSPASDGLILFTIYDQVGPSSCTTFHTIRPDGSDEQQLAVGCPVFGSASWSPAGDGIIIDSSTLSGNPTQISKVAIDGSAPHVLLTVPGFTPALSPDGSQIAYEDRSGSIVIAAADGTRPRKLTSTPDPTKSADSEPSFAPDGSRLVFTRITNGKSDTVPGTIEVWMVNTDGTDLHRLTATLRESESARWSSDGSTCCSRAPDGDEALGRGGRLSPDGMGPTSSSWTQEAPTRRGTGPPNGPRIVYIKLKCWRETLRATVADGSGVNDLFTGEAKPKGMGRCTGHADNNPHQRPRRREVDNLAERANADRRRRDQCRSLCGDEVISLAARPAERLLKRAPRHPRPTSRTVRRPSRAGASLPSRPR